MSTASLPWPDLSAYNLLLTVTHDKQGNRALIIRPKDASESIERTKARVQAMAPKIDQVCQKVGTGQIRSRVLREQYLVFTGPMVRNQALINRFFGRLFPKSSTIELTLAEAESAEVVRNAAKAISEQTRVGPKTPFDVDQFNEVSPIRCERTDMGLRILARGNDPVAIRAAENITNEQARDLLKEYLVEHWDKQTIHDIDVVREWQVNVNQALEKTSAETSYWKATLLALEKDYLENLEAKLKTQDPALREPDEPYSLADLEALRDHLKQRLENQGRVSDSRLLERLDQLEREIAKVEAGTGTGEPERDNVQESDSDSEGEGFDEDGRRVIGQNVEGDTLYEDRRGIRSRVEGQFRITEKVRMVPVQGGIVAKPDADNRDESWMTVEEALDRAPSALSFEDMIRAAFSTRVTQGDAHYWKPLAINHADEHHRFLVRARERGNLKGPLELITLREDESGIWAYSQHLSPLNERSVSGLPYAAPMVLIDLWEDAGFPLSENDDQNEGESPESDRARANLENEQLNSEDGHATDNTQSADAHGPDGAGRDALSTGVGGAGGISEQSNPGDGSAGTADGDLLEQREQSGAAGQPGERNEPELAGGEGGVEGAESDGGPALDAERTAGNGAGGRGSVGAGSEGSGREADGEGTELSDPAQAVSGEQGATGNDRAISGRNDGTGPDAVSDSDRGAALGDGGKQSDPADGADGGSAGTGSSQADAVTGDADDSGATAGGSVGRDVPENSGEASGSPESVSAGQGERSGGGSDDSERADGEPDWESVGDADAFADFAGPERFYAPSDENPRSAAQRLKDNVAALTRLSELERNGETPTLEDREVLAGYSGFGGIHAQLFGAAYRAPDWVKKANETLRSMIRDKTITTAEYQSIGSTILNAHYTHSGVIQPMWEALDRFNVPLTRTLEPSAGILNFKAYMPKALGAKVKHLTAVELDPLTARIAQTIHPDATVINKGLEKTKFPDNFFDCAISNIPFGDYNVFDPEKPLRKTSIHNTFFLKALDKVRPGGVIAFLTSSYVLDSRNSKIREEIMDRSHVVGAVRLPSGTFEKSTGTEVVTDILFLQKKGDFKPNYTPLNILDTQTIEAPLASASAMDIAGEVYQPGDMVPNQSINQVYVEHPENVLGDLGVMSSQHGPALRVTGGGEIAEQRERLREALKTLPANLPKQELETLTPDEIENQLLGEQTDVRDLSELPGALSLQGTKIMVNTLNKDGTTSLRPWEPPKSALKRVLATIQAMSSLHELMDLETTASDDSEIAELERRREVARADAEELVRLSDGKKPIAGASLKVLAADARFKLLQGAISVDNQNRWSLADIYHRRTVEPKTTKPSQAESLEDALAISLAYTAQVSETYMAQLLSHKDDAPTTEDIRQQLVDAGLAFIDPETSRLVERSEYLSGNLRPKIDVVEQIVASDPSFQVNLDALNKALPEPLKPSQIKVSLDAFWLPQDVMEAFLSEGLQVQTEGRWGVRPYFDHHKRHWRLEPSALSGAPSMRQIASQQEHVAKSRWGSDRRNVFELLDNAFTNTIPKVLDPIPGTEPTRYQTNTQETLKAQAKHEEIVDAFDRWVFKKPDRAQRLADIYNERFNTWVLHDPDGSHMVYPGMADSWVPRKHQNDFIWRAISGKNSMTAHVVGAGKTMQLIGTAIRGKQMGRWNKPLIVVPNHMLEQFTNDGHDIFPGAKILAMSAADARADNRAAFAARCAMGDWDMVVCTHSVFEKITVPQEFEAKIIDNELQNLRATLNNEEEKKRPKEVEKAIKRLEERLERTMENINRDKENILNLGQIGVDFIGIDEAHYYKNLMVDTSQQIPGVSNASSQRAMNMLIKCKYMNELHEGPYGVMMATGTPISNSVTECYTFMRMLRPDLLAGMGIENFNDWMGLFGEIKHGMEIKPEGGGYQMKSRLSRFKNIPELVKTVRTFVDFKTREDLNLPTPNVVSEQIAAPQSPLMENFMKYIEARAREARGGNEGGNTPAEKIAREIRSALNQANDKSIIDNETGELDPDALAEPAQDILLTIATDGRKASLDPRLIHPKFDDFEDSKVNQCVRKCLELYQRFDEQKAAQMIFCDFSSPTGKGIFNVYDDVKAKLIKGGVDPDEVAFIHDAKSDSDKEKLFAKVRSGEVRFLLGSTQKMGVGTNVQERLVAMHQLDPPWKPADVEQRLGRMDRQGNMFDEVYNFIYVTQDSFDLFMWETLNRKLKMIQQAMRKPEDCARELNEETEVGYEDILAVTTGNPAIRDFLESRVELDRLKRMQDSHIDQQADLATRIHQQSERVKNIEGFLKVKEEEKELVNQKLPLHFEFDGPVPGLSDGAMCSAGGLDGLTETLKNICQRAPAYRTVTVGTFGGLNVKVSRLSSEPTLILERLNGQDEIVHRYADKEELLAQERKRGLFDENEIDEDRDAAKALARAAHKIARDNGIEKTVETLDAAKKNLKELEDDLGKPFEYEDQLASVRNTFEKLSAELGDEIDSEKPMNPGSLIELARMIHEQTGEHASLERVAREIGAPVETLEHFRRSLNETDDQDDLMEMSDHNEPGDPSGLRIG
ncbi:helicase-related protein [Marinobacter subterrani]|uniref:helicase-related protein n=1 Tax=Marinobacter subterrani TaxID=1658765 RepID=UPI0023530844|nr:helicase-related protein [Marinobacter subterrani]